MAAKSIKMCFRKKLDKKKWTLSYILALLLFISKQGHTTNGWGCYKGLNSEEVLQRRKGIVKIEHHKVCLSLPMYCP